MIVIVLRVFEGDEGVRVNVTEFGDVEGEKTRVLMKG